MKQTLNTLAATLAEAVAKDETPEEGGCDLSAGMYGPNVSDWLRDVAARLEEPATASPDELMRRNHKLANCVSILIEGCLSGKGSQAISAWDALRGK